ncbi:penicillin-binding transpeptidase domain-containing protein [Streptomyces sp. ICBB 8177]|uniref:penicillin-binding transpeptidase domain-containing protein n=1 Tax=Streptomyces sp. ICBB 8177 TaxID=563922 RepID=UPI000D672B94|nr:penicillin-binding transpeptidase domain-containing protein [Streptomyces sp. ICBB 8177]PWI46011.1 penicillin-binding protein [Streptomyces sp. ICBB 8177]
MQRGTKSAVIGGLIAVVVGGVAYGGYDLYHGGLTGHDGADGSDGKVATGPLSATEVDSAANGFLTAWAAGDTAKAAALTDDPSQASAALGSFRTNLHATALTLTPQQTQAAPSTGPGTAAAPTRVPFSAKATFDYAGQQSSWAYDSALTVVRDTTTGKPVVKWAPSVVSPRLAAGQSLEAAPTGAPPLTAVDRTGKPLSATAYPSLSGILQQLAARYGTKVHGTPGMAVRVREANGTAGPVLHTLSQGKAGSPLPTTIDSRLQAEAEKAIKTEGPDASFVAVQPSTGDILAVADNPAYGYDKAMLGQYASGSTFKVITASTLLSTGKYTPTSKLACPKTITYGGRSFHNVEGEDFANATTVATDFAASCNTAFISTASVLPDGAVENEAKDVFGLGLTWNTGVSSWDGKVPAGTGSLKASTYIGQGEVQVNPLNMASVAATAKTGVFHQPVIVPDSVDHRQLAQAPRQLGSTVSAEIRSMMVLTAREGTAEPTIGSLSGDVGAKTGTAEVDGQTKPNSWFIAYRGDVAAAAVVPNTGEGYKYAGKIVTAVLSVS